MTITTLNRRPIRRAVWIVPSIVFACVVLAVPCSRADDDVVVEEQFVPDQARSQPVNAQQAASQVASLVQNYEQQVYQLAVPHRLAQPVRAGKMPSARERIAWFMAEWLRRIDVSCGLTGPQRSRLEEALRDDVEVIIEEIEADVTRYKAVRFEDRDPQFFQEMYRVMTEDATRVRELLSRSFDGDSRLFKVLQTTLSAEQHDRLVADFAARRAGRWAAAVASTMDSIDQAIGLTARQYSGLEQALLSRQPALRVYPPHLENRQQWHVLVCIELAGIDEDVLKAIVNERQWAFLTNLRRTGETSLPHYVKQGWYEP